jgi:6-phospho-beta-glucosidase
VSIDRGEADENVARIKLVYLGGGSTRAAGTMASFMHNGADFDGSEVVLVDLDPDRLELIRKLADGMAKARGLDITVTATSDRRAAFQDCDAVLSSFRPGGFEARALDERIPIRHSVIGQETQGPGGFFMALRAITVLKEVCAEMEQICPDAWIFNYTNPVNIVAEAVTHHSPLRIVSLCEGPVYFTDKVARIAELDPSIVKTTMVGLNHACWSVEHTYGGEDLIPHIEAAWERRRLDPGISARDHRWLRLAATMGSIPAEYFLYYYFRDEIVAEMRAKPTTRAEDIMGWSSDYWQHYREQAESSDPQLDPSRSRGGIHELELAIDVMDAIFNDRDEVHPVNVPNRGGVLPNFPDDLVVEVLGRCTRAGIEPLPAKPLPRHVRGLVEMLGEYQALAAEAAWSGSRGDAVRALSANPLVAQLDLAERIYDELANAHRRHLPDRLAA